jgi:hypothetical protein
VETEYLQQPVVNAGLCDTCRHQRIIRNTRGSAFSLCERSRTEPRYPRYPRLPVVACDGYEQRDKRRKPDA